MVLTFSEAYWCRPAPLQPPAFLAVLRSFYKERCSLTLCWLFPPLPFQAQLSPLLCGIHPDAQFPGWWLGVVGSGGDEVVVSVLLSSVDSYSLYYFNDSVCFKGLSWFFEFLKGIFYSPHGSTWRMLLLHHHVGVRYHVYIIVEGAVIVFLLIFRPHQLARRHRAFYLYYWVCYAACVCFWSLDLTVPSTA